MMDAMSPATTTQYYPSQHQAQAEQQQQFQNQQPIMAHESVCGGCKEPIESESGGVVVSFGSVHEDGIVIRFTECPPVQRRAMARQVVSLISGARSLRQAQPRNVSLTLELYSFRCAKCHERVTVRLPHTSILVREFGLINPAPAAVSPFRPTQISSSSQTAAPYAGHAHTTAMSANSLSSTKPS